MVNFHLPCKPYVKHYLENCFGSPAYIRMDGVVGKYLFQLIGKDCEQRDKTYENSVVYQTECCIMITEDVFLRKGYMLSVTNIHRFNVFVEENFKTQIFIMMDAMVEFQGHQIIDAIDCVYDKFDMDETIMPKETIIKGYQRYRKSTKAA